MAKYNKSNYSYQPDSKNEEEPLEEELSKPSEEEILRQKVKELEKKLEKSEQKLADFKANTPNVEGLKASIEEKNKFLRLLVQAVNKNGSWSFDRSTVKSVQKALDS